MEQATQSTSSDPGTGGRWGRLRRRLIRFAVLLAILAGVLALAHRPLLVGFARSFRVDDPAKSDALVILLGGADHRAAKVLDLYRKGFAPVILLGELDIEPELDLNESKAIADYLIRKGVPPGAIHMLPGGPVASTFDEAERVRDYLQSHPARRITLVTTAFHTARARRIFRKVLRGRGVDVRAAAAPKRAYDESNWYRTEAGLVDYFEESIKTLRYWVLY